MKSLLILTILLVAFSPQITVAETDYLQQGAIHLEGGKYKKAVRSYELAIKSQQDSAEAYKGIGLAYYKLGHNEHSSDFEMLSTAVNAFNKSLAIKQDAEVYYTLGLSYLALEDMKKAEIAHLSLKSINSSLAEMLAAKITAYGAPRNYTFVPNPEEERREVLRAIQRRAARERDAKSQEAQEIAELKNMVTEMGSKINPCPPGYIDIPSKGMCVTTPAEEQRRRMEIYNNSVKALGLDDESIKNREIKERLDKLESDNRRLKSDKWQLEFEKSRYRRY